MIELRVVYPDNTEKKESCQGEVMTLGRKPFNDLVLAHSGVSSRHGRFTLRGEEIWVEDLGSLNGTLFNGLALKVPTHFTSRDVIVIGEFKITLWTHEPDLSAPAVGPTSGALHPDASSSPFGDLEIPPFQAPEISREVTPAAAGSIPADGRVEVTDGVPEADAFHYSGSSATADALPAYRPPVPQNIDETGLKRTGLIDLLLKATYYAGEISGYDLARATRLPFTGVVEPLLQDLRKEKLLEVKGGGGNFGLVSMVFSLTLKAGDVLRQILERNRYYGPAPVSMEEYLRVVAAQSIRRCKIPKRRLVREFEHLIVDDHVYDGIGPAMNSGTAILFYGPPGNGKTAICQAMVNCLDDNIFIPYAIEVDGDIIQVFDEHNHHPVPRPGNPGEDQEFDQRFVLCRRPLVMVGGELTLDMLDMRYSADARYYEAPFQMKANGGILLVDDFGRQKVSPRDLLNRWIVPLESEIDFIALVTGKKLRVPFDVFVAFATNLNPQDLVDDAFLRRVRYKIEVRRPNADQFRSIFASTCGGRKLPWSEEGFQLLMDLYRRDGRPLNACEPRNIISAIQCLADYFECDPELSADLVARAYDGYFTRFSPTDTPPPSLPVHVPEA